MAVITDVRYTGVFPHKCSGELWLTVDGERYCFNSKSRRRLPNVHYYERFWSIGDNPCSMWFRWRFEPFDVIPDAIKPFYKQLKTAFDNAVRCGCCMGCH